MTPSTNLNATFLKTVNIFRELPAGDLELLAAQFETRELESESVIIHEGELSDEFFLLRSGTAKVTRGKIGEEVIITSLNPGDYFGEAALFQNVKRTANIQAIDYVTLLVITKKNFEQFLDLHPAAAKRILHGMLKQLFFRLQKTSAQLEFERQGGLAHNALKDLLS
ncbi:MAG: cyclic nucleotide-binding domain-containing protein [Oligoflexia bacterium]|nr:cyclic nucleotide-binding domain-containing protein [Oligoflexia bacterium]